MESLETPRNMTCMSQDGFIFKYSNISVPSGSLWELLMTEAHGGALGGHFGINKTTEILKEHLCWPRIASDVHKVSKVTICHIAKSSFH